MTWLPFYPVKSWTPAGQHIYVSKFAARLELFKVS